MSLYLVFIGLAVANIMKIGQSAYDADIFYLGWWYGEAEAAGLREPHAMTLATATREGRPSARVVLLRGFDERGFCFFTNYESRKGRELAENPAAALVFLWSELERQVRIEGTVERTSEAESESYFQSRPAGSRIGAWASPQSQVITSRAELERAQAELEAKHAEGRIPRPPHWGGFRLRPRLIEFWQGRPSRLHDRLEYRLEDGGGWRMVRLAP